MSTRAIQLGAIAVYGMAIAGFVYAVAEPQRTYGNSVATLAVFAALAVLNVGAGFAIGRWWALLLIPLAILIALPAGYPNDVRGEPWPIWTTFAIWAPAVAALVGLGIVLRRVSRPEKPKRDPAAAV